MYAGSRPETTAAISVALTVNINTADRCERDPRRNRVVEIADRRGQPVVAEIGETDADRRADQCDEQAFGQHLRISRPRVAPSDDRTASSFARSVARANCMFITLTHAISSTPTQNRASSAASRAVGRRERLDQRFDLPALNCLFVSG